MFKKYFLYCENIIVNFQANNIQCFSNEYFQPNLNTLMTLKSRRASLAELRLKRQARDTNSNNKAE